MMKFFILGFKKTIGFYKNLSIRNKLMWVLIIQVLIPLIILGFLSFRTSSDIINKNALEYSKGLLNMMRIRLEDYIRNVETISDDLYSEQNVYELLYSDYLNKKPIDYYETQNKVANLLRNIVISREEIKSLFFISANNQYYKSENNLIDETLYSHLKNAARENTGRPVWLHYDDGNLYLARVINNIENYEEIGFMVIQLDKEYLSKLCSVIQKNLWNTAFISDNKRIIVESSISSNTKFNPDIISNINLDDKSAYTSWEGMFIYWVRVPETNWLILSYIPSDQLYMDATILRNKITYFAILVVLILSIVNAYIAFDIIQPINKLVNAMKHMRHGETKVQIEIDRHDELGFLKKEFNKMSKKINYLLKSVYMQQLVNKEAQLKALQAQINPHFLFNTLESINWMAQLKNAPEISEVVSALSDIMESGIGRDNKPITLRAEMNYVEKYILIMKKRFEDKLEFRKAFDKAAMNVKVPKLMIQPLIENAVYHGVESSRKKGIIYIRIYIKDENVVIEVIDNGSGIAEEDLKDLNQKLKKSTQHYFTDTNENEKSKSIGLENVSYRIKLLFGEEYGLEAFSRKGFFTKVRVVIPNIKNEI